MMIEKHTLALVSIIGCSFDVLGSLYLAYDLLGGQHGPLRTLTRAVTYGVLMGAGFAIALGPVFGIACGVTHGITLAWEFARAARQGPKPGLGYDVAMSAIRGFGYAIGGAYLYGWAFGITFGVLSTVGTTIAYRVGIRPEVGYAPTTRPRMTKFQLLAVLNRIAGYVFTGYISALASHHRDRALSIGLEVGLLIGFLTAILSLFSPYIEWEAEHIPEKRMGVVGISLILIGFAMQSIQYWAALLDVNVR